MRGDFMQAGISTACLYPMLLEDSFSQLIQLNFRCFEVFLNTCSEFGEPYLKRLRRMADNSGSRIRSLHPFTSGYENFLLFSDYERRYRDGLEFYKHYFHACNLLGADLLVLHGKRSDKPGISDKEFFERYSELYDLGRTFKVTVAQENVNLYRSDDPEFIKKMRVACGKNCAFVLDVKQAVRGGTDPFLLCEAMGEQLAHVHINDNNAVSDCLLPGFGSMDFPRLIRQLRRQKFNGNLIIEVYRKSFGKLDELVAAEQVVESLLQN
jgi:sugar phosphate isomerase/epimerase